MNGMKQYFIYILFIFNFAGMTSLEVDWLDDPQNYTCYGPELPIAEARSSLVLTKRMSRERGVITY